MQKERSGNTSLSEVINYYLSGKYLLTKAEELKRQILLAVISLSGGALYFDLAKKLAARQSDFIDMGNDKANQLNCGLSVLITALTVLYVSTDLFFDQRRNEKVPAELTGQLKPKLSLKEKKRRDMATVVGALLSAIPLSMVSIFYPIYDSLLVKIIEGLVVLFDNTILHFLPLKLAMTRSIYRFPVLPIEWLIKRCSKKNENELAPPIENSRAEKARQNIISQTQHAKQQITQQCTFDPKRFSYQWNIGSELKQVPSDEDQSEKNLWEVIRERYPLPSPAETKSSSSNCSLETSIAVGSSFWILGAFTGYLISPFLEIYKETKSITGTFFATLLPTYFLGVLINFFGFATGKMLYGLFTEKGSFSERLPFEFKLRPKIFSLMTLVNIYLNLFSYAGAEELIHEWVPDDPEWETLKTVLIWLARTGAPVLCFKTTFDLTKLVILKWVLHYGEETEKMLARFVVSSDQLMSATGMIAESVLLSEGVKHEESKSEGEKVELGLTRSKAGQPTHRVSFCNKVMQMICFWRSAEAKKGTPKEPLLPISSSTHVKI